MNIHSFYFFLTALFNIKFNHKVGAWKVCADQRRQHKTIYGQKGLNIFFRGRLINPAWVQCCNLLVEILLSTLDYIGLQLKSTASSGPTSI